MAQKIIAGITLWLLTALLYAQESPDFRSLDTRLLGLYEREQWDSLKTEGNVALELGVDYYYLRMRLGIAWFETGNYLKAAPHFRRALEFNPGDPVASEYLFFCYYNLNDIPGARQALAVCPPSLRAKLEAGYPLKPDAYGLEGGWLACSQDQVFPGKDPDGADNLYGEADILKGGLSTTAWGTADLSRLVKVRFIYSYVMLDKFMTVAEGNKTLVNHPYRVNQHQAYLGASFTLPGAFQLHPAVHFITTGLDEWEYITGGDGSIMPEFSRRTINSWIGFLAVSRDYGIVQPMIFVAMAGLNQATQTQGGFNVTILPFGNLDFYLSSALTGHRDRNDLQFVFDQLIGFKVANPLWLEVSASAGKRTNYFDESGSLVYNIPDEIRFIGKTKLILLISASFRLTINYDYLARADEMVYYESYYGIAGWSARARHKSGTYHSQYLSGGLTWKF